MPLKLRGEMLRVVLFPQFLHGPNLNALPGHPLCKVTFLPVNRDTPS